MKISMEGLFNSISIQANNKQEDVAVETTPAEIPLCEWCPDGDKKPAIARCNNVNHDCSLCQECLADHNEENDDHMDNLEWYGNQQASNDVPNMIIEDSKNKFILFDKANGKLQLGNRFSFFENDPQTLICSLIGPTGSGKSFYGAQICDPSDSHPFIGKANCTQTTSSDVNAYCGYLSNGNQSDHTEQCASGSSSQTKSDSIDFLLLDVEGINGTFHTKMDDASNIEISNENIMKKRKISQISYPRITYLFSDLVCFITTQSIRQKEDIAKGLLSYSQSAAAKSNMSQNPLLLIIFSKVQADAVQPSKEATESWFAAGSPGHTLTTLYDDPTVVCIPDKDNEILYNQQIEEMKRVIFTKLQKRKETKRHQPQENVFSQINKAVAEFDKDPQSVFTPPRSFQNAPNKKRENPTSTARSHVCQASKIFGSERVFCELSKGSHGSTHKSSKTYKPTTDLTEFERETLGWTEQQDKACWWKGEFEDHPTLAETCSQEIKDRSTSQVNIRQNYWAILKSRKSF